MGVEEMGGVEMIRNGEATINALGLLEARAKRISQLYPMGTFTDKHVDSVETLAIAQQLSRIAEALERIAKCEEECGEGK
jgi:hypothetical protein